MPGSSLLFDGQALLDAERLIRAGVADRRASFELSFAEVPPHTGFLVAAGFEDALEALSRDRPDEDEVLATQHVVGFSDGLGRRLQGAAFNIDLDAMPDGTVAFADTPIATVEGRFVEALLVASLLVRCVRRGTAIATRAARLHVAASGGLIVDGASARAAWAGEALAIARAAHVGGAAATTCALAASALGIPFRGEAMIDLGALSPVEARADEGWGVSNTDRLAALGGHDEEAMLLETKRLQASTGGWIASGLAEEGAGSLVVRCELVALEEGGAWAPRRGMSDRNEVFPGRKMVARCFDAEGRAVSDVVHLAHERMRAPRALGAVKLLPLARAVMRAGRALEAPEPPRIGRERSIAARQLLPRAVMHLFAPARYRVEISAGVHALGDHEDVYGFGGQG
jgi:nicotinate phosphoribosyltransferase